MQLKIKLHTENIYPLKGILIKGTSVGGWLFEIQRMGFQLMQVDVYALPGNAANSIWGCLVVSSGIIKDIELGRNNICQVINDRFFIPQRSALYPSINTAELDKLLKDKLHLFHPEIGMVALGTPLNWGELLEAEDAVACSIQAPANTIVAPSVVRSFQIQQLPPEEVLKQMDEQIIPGRNEVDETPLSAIEKLKLALLRPFFKETAGGKNKVNEGKEGSGLLDKVSKLFSFLANNKFVQKLEENFEALENRNKSEVNKLLELFKQNPEEALKYAVPLNDSGSERGGNAGAFSMLMKRFDFSLWGNNSSTSGGGSFSMGADQYLTLRQQYEKTAQELIKQGDFEKAAFVYLKLLKNPYQAAQVLEDGKLYSEAASVHLKLNNNKEKAADCYEKGHMTMQAIELFKELGKDEKVGDLYLAINEKTHANKYFEKVVDNYKTLGKYVKASLVYRNKIKDTTNAQSLLMTGWLEDKDAYNCLNNYFNNIEDIQILEQEIERVYNNATDKTNNAVFLEALKQEFNKHAEIAETTRNIAYEIIAEKILSDRSFSRELQFFNKDDKHLLKDVTKFTLKR